MDGMMTQKITIDCTKLHIAMSVSGMCIDIVGDIICIDIVGDIIKLQGYSEPTTCICISI